MPRNPNLGTSTLRNRNRVTNKTRLKVYHGTIDADPLVLDEDEEKARIVSTAGVDAEDANEHHLQAVLSAASQRHQPVARSTRGAAEKSAPPPAYIPTPDSTGVVHNYEEYYPTGRWRDPVSYIKSSETVDEASSCALTDGFTYFMDERDKEWLDRNNEEARGEGTSVQGALSAPTTATRSGSAHRSAKSKGKEPDVAQPFVISEDEFELVMGMYEKVTHEKTEFLHHALEQGMQFPPFSHYQDILSAPLALSMFTTFVVPSWVPPSTQLLRLAQVIYPYWKERRIERGGHRIIPILNYDESDVPNESYICFRRREIKAVRKTRASQVTSSDKLVRLQYELGLSLEIAKHVLSRENIKKDVSQQTLQVWDQRIEFADMKRKFSSLGAKEDEELLQDKERVPKKPKVEAASRAGGLKSRPNDAHSPTMQTEPAVRPKERYNRINNTIEEDMTRFKERDHQWEDMITNPYQPSPVHYTQRHWGPFLSSRLTSPSSLGEDDEDESGDRIRYLRLRFARAQRLCLDRHDTLVKVPTIHSGTSDRKVQFMRRMKEFADDDSGDERTSKIHERWRFDEDDGPVIGPCGAEEQDRILVDDYDPKYLRYSMTLLQDQDQVSLMNDPTLVLATSDGRYQPVVPFRMGMLPPAMRTSISRQFVGQAVQVARPLGGVPMTSPLPNGVPISMQVKSMQPPSIPHLRISSNGGMRPPAVSPIVVSNTLTLHAAVKMPSGAAANGGNGIQHYPLDHGDGETVKVTTANGVNQAHNEASVNDNADGALVAQSPTARAAINIPNGYHTQMNGYSNMSNGNGGTPYIHPAARQHNGLNAQQMQNLKAVFAAGQENANANPVGRSLPGSYMGHVISSTQQFNVQLGNKIPSTRQWTQLASQSHQPVTLGSDTGVGEVPSSPNMHPMSLPRTPANGSWAGRQTSLGNLPSTVGHIIGGGQLTSHSLSPRLPHSPSLSAALHPTQQSPHLQTPTIKLASPALQHQQPVGKGGY